MANLINLEQVTKSYGLKTLLDGVSLGVQTGDRIGIVGVNGGGKTTLLEVLTGIEPPDSGRVSHTSDLRMAVVTQRFDLPEELTIAQAIIEPLELETYEWASNAKVRDVLGGLGIVDLGLETPVSSLSGGERRRVNLAAALVQDLDLVVLDEPTNHLDVEGVQWLADHLLKRNLAVIVVTHDRWFLDIIATWTWRCTTARWMPTRAGTTTGRSPAPSALARPMRWSSAAKTWPARNWRGCAAGHRRVPRNRATGLRPLKRLFRMSPSHATRSSSCPFPSSDRAAWSLN